MKLISEILKDYKIERPKTNPRNDLIKQFMVEINKERRDKLPWIAINMKLIHLKEYEDLREFFKKCWEYRNRKGSFNKCFFGCLKIKKNE